MKLRTFITLTTVSSAILFSGCSSEVHSLQAKLAAEQTKNLTKKLQDGSIVHFDINVAPTPDWGCNPVGQAQSFNWAHIQNDQLMHISGPYNQLMDTSVKYLDQNNLKANYVNMQIPEQHTSSFSDSEKETTYTVKNPGAMGHLNFYMCQKINPDLKLGVTKQTDVGIGIGKGGNNVGTEMPDN